MKQKKNIKLKNVRLTKTADNAFKGSHPNGIIEGTVREGFELVPPTIGEAYWVGNYFRTSPVTMILGNGKFRTLYSTYKIKYIK